MRYVIVTNFMFVQEKPKTDFRDLRHSIAFKVAPNGNVSGKTESPNCLVDKVMDIFT